jgi:hypothetical protein
MSWHYTDEWAAGFFDGEGCVCIQKRLRGNFLEHFLSVQVGQSTRLCLDELAARFGGGVTSYSKTGGKFWRWRLHGTKAERFLKTIQPHSLVKRREIDAAIELRSAIGSPGKRSTPWAREKKEAAYSHWKEAKHDVALSRLE